MHDFKVSSAKQAIAELKKRGYSDDSIHRYARAARSWCKRDGAEWKVWREVEKQTSTPAVQADDQKGIALPQAAEQPHTLFIRHPRFERPMSNTEFEVFLFNEPFHDLKNDEANCLVPMPRGEELVSVDWCTRPTQQLNSNEIQRLLGEVDPKRYATVRAIPAVRMP